MSWGLAGWTLTKAHPYELIHKYPDTYAGIDCMTAFYEAAQKVFATHGINASVYSQID